ncbi:MAG: PHP domain-containing protein [Clostridiales Family XIII bacterium]|jgi:putative hydrolase|nr:PHP domain-containing protein [Clostridiales Family XIII bacterium]
MTIEKPVDQNSVEVSVNGVRYELESDLHTHTVYSHGTGTIEDNVLSAREKGLKKIGIADHGPGHLGYGVQRKNLVGMKAEIGRLRLKYSDIEILFGVEANILSPHGRLDLKPAEYEYFDFVCAGWHYGAVDGLTPAGIAGTLNNLARNTAEKATKRQLRRNTDTIVGALEAGGILFLTHPGDKAPVDLLEVAAVCARTGTLVEINTSHMSLTAEDIKMMLLADIRFIIGSDAHTPGRIGDFLPAVRLLIDAGASPERVVNLKRL